MTEPDPLRPAGAHRRPAGKHRLAVLLASLLAIAIVAVAVRFILHDRGEPASAPTPSAHSSFRSATPSSTASPSTSASVASPSPSSSPTPTATPAPTPAPKPTPTPAPKPALDVLNDSRITRLAAHASEQFRAGGWSVATVGNFKGDDVPETTIFFPDAEKPAAQALAAQFAIDRVLPAPSGLSSTHLSVVVARDWAGRG